MSIQLVNSIKNNWKTSKKKVTYMVDQWLWW